MIDALPLLLGPEGYQISRSVRLRSSASAYFNRTPGSAGNRRTFTWSGWLKRGTLGSATTPILSVYSNGSNFDLFRFSTDSLQFYTITGGVDYSEETPAVFRDPSAWYHIVLSVDTTQATAANRIKIYVNGVQQTTTQSFGQIPQNYDTFVDSTNAHNIGRNLDNTAQVFDGYLTEINFIDGQALTPSSFGETDAVTGVWKPKKYAGTYGTNGFYLNFSDNSAATAAAIGKDYSGNGNNWTPNNISVTAGVTYDSMLDVPTQWADGGNGRGNYCTLNPLNNDSTNTLSAANLNYSIAANQNGYPTNTIQVNSRKWYWECTVTSTHNIVGITLGTTGTTTTLFLTGYGYYYNGNKYVNGSASAYGASFTTNDVIGVAVDLDSGTSTIEFFKNGTSQGLITIAAGLYKVGGGNGNSGATATGNYNFGQRPFSYTPPTGFKALNTLNLPTPTILKGNQYFDATLWDGNSTNARVITTNVGTVDFAWVKKRNGIDDHRLANSVLGGNKHLQSNTTAAESTGTTVIQAFSGSTFTVGTDNSVNVTGGTYVGWTWQEGATQGFDIQAITAQASGSASFSHSLGVAPKMFIIKPRTGSFGWAVYHASIGNTQYLTLNSTNAAATNSTLWNNTSPTSTDFTLGSGHAGTGTQIVYLFSEVAGFSKFGSYTGNGSADGPFVFTGFRPRFVMVKRTDAAGQNWVILDTSRDTSNVAKNGLYPNLSNAEDAGWNVDILSNGFKPRDTASAWNASGGTYIYAAFCESPFKNSLAR